MDGFYTGIGILAEALPHFFERYYQADLTQAEGVKHATGLGLTFAKEIVGAPGGKISARSTPNAGSTFTVHLQMTTPDTPSPNCRKNR